MQEKWNVKKKQKKTLQLTQLLFWLPQQRMTISTSKNIANTVKTLRVCLNVFRKLALSYQILLRY